MRFFLIMLASVCWAREEVVLPYALLISVNVTYMPRPVDYSKYNGERNTTDELRHIKDDMKSMLGLVTFMDKRIIVANPIGGAYFSNNNGHQPREFWSIILTDLKDNQLEGYCDIRRCDIEFGKIDKWPGMSIIRDLNDNVYPLARIKVNSKDPLVLFSTTGSYLNTIEMRLVKDFAVPIDPR